MEEIPRLGFGTWGRRGDEGVAALLAAFEAGYRHFDTAQSYDTESEVGAALVQSGLPRDEVWVTTKIDMSNFGAGKLAPSLSASVERLGTVPDLTLIHWPSPNDELPLAVYFDQLLDAHAAGLTRHIGVSNFPIALLSEAIDRAGKGVILTNQFELNPLFQNRKLADYCQESEVLVTCYLPIAKGRLGADPVIAAIAEAHGATPSQVGLAWELARGYAAIPTSGKPARIAENFGALTLVLSEDEVARIDAIAGHPRAIAPDWGPDWD